MKKRVPHYPCRQSGENFRWRRSLFLPRISQSNILCVLRVRQTPRLWTTARFRESILPKWTREQEFQNRFARNTHHNDIFLNDICDAPALFCDRAVTKRFQSYIVCLLLFHQSFIIKPSSFRFTLLHTHTHTHTHPHTHTHTHIYIYIYIYI